MHEPEWRARHFAKLEELRSVPVELALYGDSITQDWEKRGGPAWDNFQPAWRRFYGGRRAINLGYSGDTTANLLWRIGNGEAEGIAPKAAVVLIGINNLGGQHWSAADTEAGVAAVVDALRGRLPRTRILLLALLPNAWSPAVATATAEVNQDLARRDWAALGVTFLDLSPVFLRDGTLDTTLFFDPLLDPPQPPVHPTAQGQARMAAAMEPTLARLLGTPG